jgi:hypothetical protein
VSEPWSPEDRGTWTEPKSDDTFVIGGKKYDVPNPHLLDNYDDATQRLDIIQALALKRVRRFEAGVRVDLDDGGEPAAQPEPHGWSYVYRPGGTAWTFSASADNEHQKTTYTDDAGDVSGPVLYGPRDEASSRLIVYAMTGQAVTE